MEKEVLQQTGEKLIRILMFTLTLSVMSAFMFNLVLPQISEEFNLTIAQVSWVSSAYVLIYAIGSVTYGKLADSYKLKNLLTFGLIFFAVGSLIGLASQAFWMVLVGRCLQAVGAAVIPATAMLIPIRYFAPERRGSAIGTATVGLALGNALGPVISAFIVSFANWRWLFCVPLLLLITLPFYRKYLGDEQGNPGKFDWVGGGLLAATVALLLLGVTNGTWLFITGGLLILVLFIVRIRSTEEPSWIGFAMVPAAIASAILGRKAGKLADLKGSTYLFFLASGSLLTCFVLLSTFTGISPVFIAVFLIFGNVGQSFMLIAMSNSISRTLPKEQVGVGMGIFSMLNFIAAAMSTGVYSRVVDLGSDAHWNPASFYPKGIIYSNIYFILAALHAGILLFYYFQFGRAKRTSVQMES